MTPEALAWLALCGLVLGWVLRHITEDIDRRNHR